MNVSDAERDPFHLRMLWDALLDVYREMTKVCDRHGLRYYACCGTALGAVRHHGFIPWDDDFDIMMPRPDYERFMRYAEKELPSYLKFINWRNTPEFTFLFGKVQDTRRDIVEKVEHGIGRKLTYGVFVDVFPIDGYPDNEFSKFLTRAVAWLFRRLKRNVQVSRRPLWMLRLFEGLLRFHSYGRRELTGISDINLSVLCYPPFEKCVWGIPKMLPFEAQVVPVPARYDEYLKKMFGDYMKLPPEAKRCPTHEEPFICAWKYGPTTDRRPY